MNPLKRTISLFFYAGFLLTSSYAQDIPELKKPKPATIGIPNIANQIGLSNVSLQVPVQNVALAIWQNDQVKVAEFDAYMNEIFRELRSGGNAYRFPIKNHLAGVEAYHKAFKELSAMLDGEQPLDLKKAIFTVENAHFNNQGKFEDFDQQKKI